MRKITCLFAPFVLSLGTRLRNQKRQRQNGEIFVSRHTKKEKGLPTHKA